MEHLDIVVPEYIGFKSKDSSDFSNFLSIFDWDIDSYFGNAYRGRKVRIDFSNCKNANYQTLSIFVLYTWWLSVNGCFVEIVPEEGNISNMWAKMGAKGWYQVLHRGADFKGNEFKPLFAVRDMVDFRKILAKAEQYTAGFNIEYEKTLRYIISELLYNTMEHGKNKRIPSIIQYSYYREKQELSIIIADLGVGIKSHLQQAYPDLENDVNSIKHALKPQVSGTFKNQTPYASNNNAGFGLFISSNIVKRLNADMYILSGKGLVHVSPTDQTSKELGYFWPGTMVYVVIQLRDFLNLSLQQLTSEFRDSASKEINKHDADEGEKEFKVSVFNFFGKYAENKESAIKFREKRIIPELAEGKKIILNFKDVISAPHSFLSALLSTPIRISGMDAYKKIKIINAPPEIRETIDFILDENTK